MDILRDLLWPSLAFGLALFVMRLITESAKKRHPQGPPPTINVTITCQGVVVQASRDILPTIVVAGVPVFYSTNPVMGVFAPCDVLDELLDTRNVAPGRV